MQAGICNLPLLPLRSESSERSEQISQLLFGELFELLDEKESWSYIRNLSDNYTGWCTTKMLQFLPSVLFNTLLNAEPIFTKALLAPCIKLGDELPQLFIPAGSRLYFSDVADHSFPIFRTKTFGELEPQKEYWRLAPDFTASLSREAASEEVLRTAMLFMNAPYLWGGKSILGIDCSGFSQLVFSIYGQILPRDARDQVLLGTEVSDLSQAGPGDLAFFSNMDGKVIHVGILLDNCRILHASGCVRIDRMDQQGIYCAELGKYTHKLCSIKRFSMPFPTNC